MVFLLALQNFYKPRATGLAEMSNTELKHSRGFLLSLEGYQNIFGLFVIQI